MLLPWLWYNRAIKGGGDMEFLRITNAADGRLPRALRLYEASFPFHERREAESQARIFADPEYHF